MSSRPKAKEGRLPQPRALNKGIYKRGSRSVHRRVTQLTKAFGDATCMRRTKKKTEVNFFLEYACMAAPSLILPPPFREPREAKLGDRPH
jgi:hypothetical protein